MSESPYASHDHLPQTTGERSLLNPRRLPEQRRGTAPQGRSRYPDMDAMAEADAWDEPTRTLLEQRVQHPPPVRFFTAAEARTVGALLDAVLAQDGEPRVPALELLDAKLHEGRLEGYQYVTLPDDRTLWQRVATGLDEAAGGGPGAFADLSWDEREEVVGRFAEGTLRGGAWNDLHPGHAWSMVSGHVLEAFWSHPWAWNEMGFPGPAYPRGYARLGRGQRERFEAFEEGPLPGPSDSPDDG